MSDKVVVHIGENSPEQVAYKLMRDINNAEYSSQGSTPSTRESILDTYAECLIAVRGFRDL